MSSYKKLKIFVKNYFSLINFSNPLYFLTKLWVQFGLTSHSARTLILFFKTILLLPYWKKWYYGTPYWVHTDEQATHLKQRKISHKLRGFLSRISLFHLFLDWVSLISLLYQLPSQPPHRIVSKQFYTAKPPQYFNWKQL